MSKPGRKRTKLSASAALGEAFGMLPSLLALNWDVFESQLHTYSTLISKAQRQQLEGKGWELHKVVEARVQWLHHLLDLLVELVVQILRAVLVHLRTRTASFMSDVAHHPGDRIRSLRHHSASLRNRQMRSGSKSMQACRQTDLVDVVDRGGMIQGRDIRSA